MIAGDDVRVDDRREALRVPGGDRGAHGFARRATSSLMRSKMTTFASAATPIVRIMPAKPGRVSVTFEEQDRRVQEDRVDAETEDCDEAEEAVEEQQEERDDEQAADRRVLRLPRASPCRASPRCLSRSIVTKLTGSAPVWSTSARSFASLIEPMPVICAPPLPGIPLGFSL